MHLILHDLTERERERGISPTETGFKVCRITCYVICLWIPNPVEYVLRLNSTKINNILPLNCSSTEWCSGAVEMPR